MRETVLMKDRGKVVAEIVAPQMAFDALSAEQNWAELERQGIIETASVGPEAPLPPRRKPSMKLDEVLCDLDADRSDR